jgi:hypothetical protein
VAGLEKKILPDRRETEQRTGFFGVGGWVDTDIEGEDNGRQKSWHGNPQSGREGCQSVPRGARLKMRFSLRCVPRTLTRIGAQERTDCERSLGSLALFGCPAAPYISSKFLISLGHPI